MNDGQPPLHVLPALGAPHAEHDAAVARLERHLTEVTRVVVEAAARGRPVQTPIGKVFPRDCLRYFPVIASGVFSIAVLLSFRLCRQAGIAGSPKA